MMEYPYYIVPAVERLRNLPNESDEARRLRKLITANIGDKDTLCRILGSEPSEEPVLPDQDEGKVSTMSTIDAFLDKFGGNLTSPEIIADIEKKYEEPSEEVTAETEPDISKLIKEKRYQSALEIIEAQNLNNPQKSIYFAHQIRFLKKLIAIENYKQQQKADTKA